MKKGQMEMIGLVIVVVLIIIGGLFYITFSLKGKDNTKEQDQHLQSITANNLVNALIKIRICENKSVGQAIALCDVNEQLCGENACDFVKKEVEGIISSVTDKNYLFFVNKGENELFNVGNCSYGISSVPYRLDVDSTSYDVVLRLCNVDSTQQ